MFKSDKPIHYIEEDKLNRGNFAKMIAKGLIDYENDDNLCIGLIGPWGSGKTSLINMIFSEIREEKGPKEIALLNFNPWNYSSTEQLYSQFFRALASCMGDEDNKAFSSIGKLLKVFADNFSLTNPFFNAGFQVGKTVISQKLEENDIYNQSSLSQQKENICEELKKHKRKIIVAIDDVDRLPADLIRLIFKLIATIADFPNIVYLTAFDADIVIDAINSETSNKSYGEHFLEKIIQIPLRVPPIYKDTLELLFDEKFNEYFKNKSLAEQEDYWKALKPEIFGFINNVRDLNRLSNVFEFKFQLIGGDVNIYDLLALVAIEMAEPKLFHWIFRESGILLSSQMSITSDIRDQVLDSLKHLELSKNIEDVVKLLTVLFPRFADVMKIQNGLTDDPKNLKKHLRVCCKEEFTHYFSLCLQKQELARTELLSYLNLKKNLEETVDYLREKFEAGLASNVVDAIDVSLDDIQPEEAERIIHALMLSFDSITIKNNPILSQERVLELICKLFGLIQNKEIFKFTNSILKESNSKNIVVIAYFAERQNELKWNDRQCLLSNTVLHDIIKKITQQYEKIASQFSPLKLNGISLNTFFKMQDLDPIWYSNFINELLHSDPINILYLIPNVVKEQTDENGDILNVTISANSSKEIGRIPISDIEKAVQQYIIEGDYPNFSDNARWDIAGYLEGRKNNKTSIDINTCKKKVREWAKRAYS